MAKALTRYRPFIAVVAAVALVVVVLPGKPSEKSTVAANRGSNSGAAIRSDATAADASTGDGAATTDTAAADASAAATGTVGGAAGAAKATNVATGGAKAGAGTAAGTGGGTAAAGANGPGMGPDCDPDTGRLKMPSVYAFPCVPPFSGDNGGNTYKTGVTKDTITIVHYVGPTDAASQAILAAGGDNDTEDQINQQFDQFVEFYNSHTELYGRKVKVVHFKSTGKDGKDDNAGKADAITVDTKYHAFMSWGSLNNTYLNELRSRGILCVCTTTLPKDFYLDHAPFVWGNGLPDENQAYLMRSEMICNQIAPFPAQYAGDENQTNPALKLNGKPRSFGLIYYETTDKAYAEGEKFFEQELAKCNVTLKDKAAYIFDPTTAQQDAQTIMSRFSTEGITSVIFVGDPIYPVFYTQAANQQQYYPEWVNTGSALTDTSFFARTYDQKQWAHNFGLSLLAARGPKDSGDAAALLKWWGQAPKAPGTYGTIWPTVHETFMGLSLAGPHLDPNSFRDGMFSFPKSPPKGGITKPLMSFGRQLWTWDDYNLFDDSTEIWWDANAQGPDELNNNGTGLYRFVAMGKRYLPGGLPTGPFPAFKTDNTVLIYDKLPDQDRPPKDYADDAAAKKGYH
jgi:hypothetical protein